MTDTAITKTLQKAPRGNYTIEVDRLSEETLKHVTPGIVDMGVDPVRVRDAVIKSYDLGDDYGLDVLDESVVFYYAVTGRLDRHLDVLSPMSVANDPAQAARGEITFLENHTRTLGLTSEIRLDDYGPIANGLVIGSEDFRETLFLQVKARVHRTASFGFLKSSDDFDMVEPSAMLNIYGEWWADPVIAQRMTDAGALVTHYRRVETYETTIVSTAPAQPFTLVLGTKIAENGTEIREELASAAIRTPVHGPTLAEQIKTVDAGTLETEERAELKHAIGLLGADLMTAETARGVSWILQTADLIKSGTVS